MGDPQEMEEPIMEGEEEVQEFEDQETQLLQHFTAQDEHGNTIVLTAEQMQSYQDQLAQQVLEGGGEVEEVDEHQHLIMQSGVEDAETQEIVNEILDTEHELDTQEICEMDEGHHVTSAEFQELITLHTVDAEGNLVSGIPDEEDGHEHEHEEQMEEHMDLDHVDDEIQIEHEEEHEHVDDSMLHAETEEVITSTAPEDDEEDDVTFGLSAASFGETNSEMTHQFLSVQDSVFNPVTGTLQPISSVMANTTQTPTPATPPKAKKPAKVKYVIANSSGDAQGQQILLDASQLQGLLQGGGNTITLSGASGKQSILVTSPQKGKIKSPMKILPAPVPIGDQQQGTSTPRRILLKQGNVLTPVSISGSSANILQVTGSGNQVKYLRLVQNKSNLAPLNKIPISPAKPRFIQKSTSGGQTVYTLPAGTDLSNLTSSGLSNLLMLPNVVVKSEHGSTPVSIRPALDPQQAAAEQAMLTLQQNFAAHQQVGFESFRSLLEPNGMRPRKPCNCTKSQCLKLYCDCFANGEFCHLCNCTNCFNNLTHEEDRQKAIKLVLERNPGAFRPKIGKSSQTGEAHERRHNKGCNCRRSGCLKNYCECYEAKIFCSGICKCTGCKNCIENIPSGLPNGVGVEQHFAGAGTSHRQTLKDLAEAAEVRVQQQNQVRNKMKAQWQEVSTQNNIGCTVPAVVFRHPQGSISYDVVTSTVDLLLAKGEAGERQHLSEEDQERILIEEFGECLAALMELGTSPGLE